MVFHPSLNFLLKPVVAKAAEGGVKAAIRTFRQLLPDFHPTEDLSEQQLAASLTAKYREDAPPGPSARVDTPPLPPSTPLPSSTSAPAPPPSSSPLVYRTMDHGGINGGGGGGFIHILSDQLASRNQAEMVAQLILIGIQVVGEKMKGGSAALLARIAAALLTILMVSLSINLLGGLEDFCHSQWGGGVLWALCFPIRSVIHPSLILTFFPTCSQPTPLPSLTYYPTETQVGTRRCP